MRTALLSLASASKPPELPLIEFPSRQDIRCCSWTSLHPTECKNPQPMGNLPEGRTGCTGWRTLICQLKTTEYGGYINIPEESLANYHSLG